jgi:hypothetical protein
MTLGWKEFRDKDAGLTVILCLQMILIFVVAPLAATRSISPDVVEMLQFGLAATAILIIARRWLTRIAVGLAFAATVAASLRWQVGETAAALAIVKVAATLLFDTMVAGLVIAAVFRPGRVTIPRILGAVIVYLYFALIFTGLYRLATLLVSPAFSNLPNATHIPFSDMLYFSLGSLTTNGSNIMAIHPLVRSLAALEAVIGQLYPATLLARLVTLHTAGAARDGIREGEK